ncbi:hypothetical protein HK414_00500 [Ramlibacter terrae]|uniref:Uncharacterized protein n=1 Tax=Ramlibacter terrae TaxID=2732511 RepID=A0ABX6NZP8_9BURK|nr:hypothetical protein HK414_00500 [Ramlibacter terrae]
MRTAASRRRWLAALLPAAFAGAGVAEEACTARVPLSTAERTIAHADAPPTRSTVTLPDDLPRPLRVEDVRVGYTLDVSRCAGAGTAALWLFRVGAPFTIHDDAGRPLALLSAGGRLPTDQWVARLAASERAVYNGRIPALFALEPGTRTVRIELLTITFIPSGIVAAELGPTNLLLPVQARTLEGVVAFADIASGVVLVLGALALLLWTRRRATARCSGSRSPAACGAGAASRTTPRWCRWRRPCSSSSTRSTCCSPRPPCRRRCCRC